MSENTLPVLVSFIVVTYNQEKYVSEAVQSALAQTYEPLEIIICDDCSQDQTFIIIEDIVHNYVGNHAIQMIRNDKNIGLVRNLEKAAALANGELLVVQAGDDISLPQRTEVLVKAWQIEPKVDLVCSDVYLIDEVGKEIDPYIKIAVRPSTLTLKETVLTGEGVAFGCAAAYIPALFKKFPPIADYVFQEDNVLTFRALLYGGVRHVREPLVKYRQHNNNIFAGKPKSRSTKYMVSYVRNTWGISLDRLQSWNCVGYENEYLRNHIVKHERLWFYRQACLDQSIIDVLKLMRKGMADSLSIRNAFGLLKLNLRIKINRFFEKITS